MDEISDIKSTAAFKQLATLYNDNSIDYQT